MELSEKLEEVDLTILGLSRTTRQSRQTLENWWGNPKKRMLIDLIIDGIKWRNR